MAGSASRANRNKRRLPEKVFKKAAYLQKHEGKDRDQAIATAASMNRSGRLTKEGKYIKTRKK